MTPAPKYKPGDRVVTNMDGPGTIETLTKITAIVRLDRGGPMARLRLDTLRPETVEDVAKRERKAAMSAWLARCPVTNHAAPHHGVWQDPYPDGATVSRVGSPADMREAAAELLLRAGWFAERPVAP